MPVSIGYNRNSVIRRNPNKEVRDRLQHARDRFYFGKTYRERLREQRWRDSVGQYMDELGWNKGDDPTADDISVNLSFSTVNTLVPFVADEAPRFLVEPYSGEASAESAQIMTSFMNRLWEADTVKGQSHLRDCTWDYLVYGDGYMQVNYLVVERPQYDAVGNIIEGRGQDIAEFTVEKISPWDLWVDPYSDGIHNARWVARRLLMPLEELKRDDRFRIIDEDEVAGGVGSNMSPEADRKLREMAGVEQWVSLVEYFDLKERWSMTFVENGPNWPVRYIVHIDCPIVQMPNYKIPNSPYHMGELEQIRSLQEELNKTRSQMVTHRARNVLKWVVRDDVIDEEGEEAIRSTAINEIIRVKGNEQLVDIIMPLTSVPMSTDNYAIDNQVRQDINEITGVNEYLRGAAPNIRRTATEASIIEGATNARTRHKLVDVENAARGLGQILLNTISDVLPLTAFEEMDLYITGREAERLNAFFGNEVNTDVILTATPETFKGKYVVFVETGSTELRNPQVKAQKFKDVAQILMNASPLLVQQGVEVNLRRILEMWLEAEGIKDVDSIFEPDEMQAEMAQRQQAQMLAPPGEARGAPTSPGDPRAQSSNAPTEAVTPENSGMEPPSQAY